MLTGLAFQCKRGLGQGWATYWFANLPPLNPQQCELDLNSNQVLGSGLGLGLPADLAGCADRSPGLREDRSQASEAFPHSVPWPWVLLILPGPDATAHTGAVVQPV